MICSRCHDSIPRLTLSQRHCLPCAKDVAALIAADAARRAPRFTARDLTEWRDAA